MFRHLESDLSFLPASQSIFNCQCLAQGARISLISSVLFLPQKPLPDAPLLHSSLCQLPCWWVLLLEAISKEREWAESLALGVMEPCFKNLFLGPSFGILDMLMNFPKLGFPP